MITKRLPIVRMTLSRLITKRLPILQVDSVLKHQRLTSEPAKVLVLAALWAVERGLTLSVEAKWRSSGKKNDDNTGKVPVAKLELACAGTGCKVPKAVLKYIDGAWEPESQGKKTNMIHLASCARR